MTNEDRRKRTRLRLRLPVLLLRTESEAPLRTETVDISNNGFYCNTTQPFAPGEKLTCLIGLPVRSTASPAFGDRFYLLADVDVVRIVLNNGSGFGVGCRISEFRVLTNDAIPSWALAKPDETASKPTIEQPV